MSVKHSLRLLTLVSLALACGCSHFQEWRTNGKVGPNHRPPTANVACEWQEYNSPYVIAAQNAVVDDSWWEVFGDPEILRFVSTANSGYLPLKSAMLRVREQCFRRNIAVGNLFPQEQEAFGRYNRIQFSDNGNQVGIPGLGQSFDLYEMGFNASWEIDVWGRLRRLVESSTAEVQASVEDVHDIRLSLTADVVSTYTLIRVLQQRIQIARDQVKAQNETLRIAEARLKNGSATKLDVTQATAIVESTKATIPQLESELRRANNQLCLLLGVPTQVLFDDQNIGDIPSTPDQVVIGMPRDLLRRRPDIRKAERTIAAQSAQIGVAAAELFPTFALRGSVNWQSFTFSDLFEGAATGGAIAPGFRWNLLNYGRLKNRVCVEQTRFEQAVVGYRQAVLNANAEVEDALTAFVKKKEEIEVIQRAVEATRESVRIATTQYREGSVDLDRVNNLRKDLIRQLDLETAAQGQATVALIRVYKTMGGGWMPTNGMVEIQPTIAPTGSELRPAPENSASPSGASESSTDDAVETDQPMPGEPMPEEPMPQATELQRDNLNKQPDTDDASDAMLDLRGVQTSPMVPTPQARNTAPGQNLASRQTANVAFVPIRSQLTATPRQTSTSSQHSTSPLPNVLPPPSTFQRSHQKPLSGTNSPTTQPHMRRMHQVAMPQPSILPRESVAVDTGMSTTPVYPTTRFNGPLSVAPSSISQAPTQTTSNTNSDWQGASFNRMNVPPSVLPYTPNASRYGQFR